MRTACWKDYELLDCSCGERLERWGGVILIRPDPQIIWETEKSTRFGNRRTRATCAHRRAEANGRSIKTIPMFGKSAAIRSVSELSRWASSIPAFFRSRRSTGTLYQAK